MLENLESPLQWTNSDLGPSFVGLPFWSLFPVLFPPSLPGPEPSCPHPPSRESPGTNKGPSQGLPTPGTVSKVTVGNLEIGLGPQTEDALRARSQSLRSFHSGQ